MKFIKYFFQFLLTLFCFILFKILGVKLSSKLGGKIFENIGPFFRSTRIIDENIKRALPNISKENLDQIKISMWNNYGRVFAEYIFIKNFRYGNLEKNIEIDGKEILEEIKEKKLQVVFISGHFSNFELMAMSLEKNNIKLATIYRPLNNIFLNIIMEKIRKKYICQNQIKKGIGGLKNLVKYKKQNFSTALMIDQRVSEGILSNLFNKKALTTTIPAQLVKKYNIPIVPVFIERMNDLKFKITINKPIFFSKDISINSITDELNKILEKMIIKKPEHWIWSHNRWK
ncbi:lysophospholipid acyltransferase family protein [Candidatus Pelagibacter communis]|uniref:lysophospholipid acyltransferase family protein n=1 Tax=Pelagibacter ubique TaxID=198252 RepID=UPI00094BF9D6|nr:lysophospholipid acyltransferase family protein [Candidatus Pelagibacter ubique]